MSLEDYKAGQVNDLKLSFDTDRRSNPTAYRSGKRDNRLLGEPTPPSLSDKQTTVFRWFGDRALIYLVVAMSVATPSKPEKLEAAKIPPYATWIGGINVLHKGALSNPFESYGLLYTDSQNGESKWIIAKEGKQEYVDIKPEALAEATEREIAGQEVSSITLCDVHNHTLHYGGAGESISDKKSLSAQRGGQAVSIPPSGSAWDDYGDVSRYRFINATFDKIRKKGVAVEIRYGVVDAAGITYYGPITDQEVKQEFPHHYEHVQQGRALRRVWNETIKPRIDRLGAAKLDKLHDRFIGDAFKLDKGLGQETLEEKRQDIITQLLLGGSEAESLARELLADHPNKQKLQENFKTMVIMRDKDTSDISNARINWRRKSLTVPPERLPSTEEYAKLRETFAQNGTKIRFVPYSQIPNEAPCAGDGHNPSPRG